MGYRDYSTALGHIVDATGHGDFTTLTAAYAAAVSGQTIFIRPGTYAENPTAKAGVNVCAFTCDGASSSQGPSVSPNVIINGTVTINSAGLFSFSGIEFRTNSAAALATSGSNVANVILTNCSVYALNATGMTLAGTSTALDFYSCTFNSASTNILFTCTGNINFQDCEFRLSSSATASTISSSNCNFVACLCVGLFITTTTNGSVQAIGSFFACAGNIFLTTSGTTTSSFYSCYINSNTASALSVGSGTTILCTNSTVISTNTNAITGAGTLIYGGVIFPNTSTINVTTQTPLPLTVQQGGTLASTFTPYAPVIAGTTATGAFQSASTGLATSGFVLTSNGSSALPSFQAVGVPNFSVTVQTFTSSGTYTPTSGMVYCTIEVLGGGGGGSGCLASSGITAPVGAGGGAGGYGRKTVASATIGASKAVTVGTGGNGGAAGANAGATGNTSSVGTIVTATGGVGGTVGVAQGNMFYAVGGAGGVGASGDINSAGGVGQPGIGLAISAVGNLSIGGAGGNSHFGGGAQNTAVNSGGSSPVTGVNGSAYGGGGSGAAAGAGIGAAAAGGNGSTGIVVITEYIT